MQEDACLSQTFLAGAATMQPRGNNVSLREVSLDRADYFSNSVFG